MNAQIGYSIINQTKNLPPTGKSEGNSSILHRTYSNVSSSVKTGSVPEITYNQTVSDENESIPLEHKSIESLKTPSPNIENRSTSTPKVAKKLCVKHEQLIRQKPIEKISISSYRKYRILQPSVENPIVTSTATRPIATKKAPDKIRESANRLSKPKSVPDLSAAVLTVRRKSSAKISTIAGQSLNLNNNNTAKTPNRNVVNSKVKNPSVPRKGTPVPLPRIKPTILAHAIAKKSVTQRRSLDLSLTRRGQGPSGSKNASVAAASAAANQQQQQINSRHTSSNNLLKASNSVSSLDGLGVKTKTSSKLQNASSNDKINHNYKNSKDSTKSEQNHLKSASSKEQIIDYCVDGQQLKTQQIIKTKKKQPNPMPIIQQQNIIANNNLLDQRDIGEYNERSVDLVTLDGNREASRQQQSMMQELQKHLERLTREKMSLEAKIVELSSYQNEVSQLHNEISKLQNLQDKNGIEIQKLSDENETLRNRLRDVVNSPLSDNEKHQIIQDSQRLHSSAPASIALPNNHEMDGTPCVTPDWDKNSSSSEVSVACLQDKIIQMEETHYSTNEELQATLQELADLQSQLTELHSDNERLAEEKDVLFQSLCRQTEKLEDSRNQILTLQELLLRETNSTDIGTTEREQKLLDLLKSAQEERENLLIKQEEFNSELNELRMQLDKTNTENKRLRERISLMDSTMDAAIAERKQIESQLTHAKEDSSEKQIEISRLSTLLDNARAKIDELEQDRAMGDKTDLGELLDGARREKDLLEAQVASLQEQFSKSQCEIQKLKDQLAGITEECKVARNNAKCALSDLEYKCETLKDEKNKMYSDYQQLQDSANELQVQCKCHLEDKVQLESLLSETQRHLGEAERMLAEKEERIHEEIKLRKQEAEEWEQFQSDLLMTVRVANDFKTEAQIAREQLVMDNKALREKIRTLENQIEKLNKQVTSTVEQSAQQSLLSTVQQEMAARRQKVGVSRQDSRLSVKSLIESIENTKANGNNSNGNGSNGSIGNGSGSNGSVGDQNSRCSSASSLNSLSTDALNGSSGGGQIHHNGNGRLRCNEWTENLHTPVVTGLTAKSPLREQQQTASTNINLTLNGGQKSLISDFCKNKQNGIFLLNNNNNNNNNIVTSNNNILNINHSSTTINHNNNNNNSQHGRFLMKHGNSNDESNVVSSILAQKSIADSYVRRNSSSGDLSERKDPLNALVKNGGSKRNALLKWCQNKTVGYRNIDITNFSSSWNDGLAFCAILHSYLQDKIPYDTLESNNKRRNFSLAFAAAESVGIATTLNINEMCHQERPDWTLIMAYVTSIYKHFEA